MKLNTTLALVLFFFIGQTFAQFTSDDIVFWMGEGDQECYLAIDFRDGATDPSFAFGFRYEEGEELSMVDILTHLSAEEPFFQFERSGMFLDDILYNSHSGIAGSPDWWSTWSGDSAENMEMNAGIGESLENGGWYGLSYGFSPQPLHPTITYPAYSSQWFKEEEFEFALGEGENTAVVVIDFVNDPIEETVSFAWKIRFDNILTHRQALQLISDNDANLEVTLDDNHPIYIKYREMEAVAWSAYEGTNLSDWKLAETDFLQDGSWLGYSKGAVYSRRPFTPVPAEASPVMQTNRLIEKKITLYPNPVVDALKIVSEAEVKLEIFDMAGRKILESFEKRIDFSGFQKGVYLIKLSSEGKTQSERIVKQ